MDLPAYIIIHSNVVDIVVEMWQMFDYFEYMSDNQATAEY
jgi:hypothetical protein